MSKNDNRRVLRISYSGHYPDIYCYVTQKLLVEIREIEKKHYLFDTERGREIIKYCEENQINSPQAHTSIGYM